MKMCPLFQRRYCTGTLRSLLWMAWVRLAKRCASHVCPADSRSGCYRSLIRIHCVKLLYQVVQLIDAGPTYSGRQIYRLRVFDVLNQSPSPEESQSEFGTTGAPCSAQEWCK